MGHFAGRDAGAERSRDIATLPRLALDDALPVTLAEAGRLDFVLLAARTGLPVTAVQQELWRRGLAFRTPAGRWETADAYLSGDVRQKLREAEAAAQTDSRFRLNATKLAAVQPRDLEPGEIKVTLGQAWLPSGDVSDFAGSLFGPGVKTSYIPALGKWLVETDSAFDKKSHENTRTWGTARVSGVELLRLSLDGRRPTVHDKVAGRKVVNQAETLAAREMQRQMQAQFSRWLWSDEARAGRLAAQYNERFNAYVPREFNGAHLTLPGIGPEMPELLPHQKNAIWRVVQGAQTGDNTLLAHLTGAGKSYTMIGAGMELRRLGLRRKVMYAVPNHLLDQFRGDIRTMYPGAKVLALSGRGLGDDEARQAAMERIANGDYDAIVVTHSAFGQLPVSRAAERLELETEVARLNEALEAEAERDPSQRAAVKYGVRRRGVSGVVNELLKARDAAQRKLAGLPPFDKLRPPQAEPEGLTFDDLGIDQLFVDEAHEFKNLSVKTRRGDVAGLTVNESGAARDMFIKTRLVQRRCECGRFIGAAGVCECGGKAAQGGGVVFASATPVSNSMSEFFAMQSYLQGEALEAQGLGHFDVWAAQYAEAVASLEMKPSGKGYQERTRFSRFVNVPELMRVFRGVADVQLDPEALTLARPELDGGKAIGVTVQASARLQAYLAECDRRAQNLRNVDPAQDNMLKIVSDAGKAALDMRLIDPQGPIDPTLPDNPGSKVNRCVAEVARIYKDTTGVELPGLAGRRNLAQMVFLDTGVPGGQTFDLYADIKRKLTAQGVKAGEIAFVHDAVTDAEKKTLFDRVNRGQVRVLIGSTGKMGTGVNAQRLLAALHHLDAPWRPADIEQREGRILRQGNRVARVQIYRYVTAGSFDVYRWQTLERKARFIAQAMRGQLTDREMADIDDAVGSYAEMKALATGDKLIIEKYRLENDARQLRGLHRAYLDRQGRLRQERRQAPENIAFHQRRAERLAAAQAALRLDAPVVVDGTTYDRASEAGEAIIAASQQGQAEPGQAFGCALRVKQGEAGPVAVIDAAGVELTAEINPHSGQGTMARLRNVAEGVAGRAERYRQRAAELAADIERLDAELARPFLRLDELAAGEARLAAIEAELAAREELAAQVGAEG